MNLCGLCDRVLEDGYLCHGCHAATARRLGACGRWYAALAAFLQPAAAGPATGARSRSEAPLPVAEGPLSLRGPGGIVGVLEDWRAAMQADRGWREPHTEGTTARRIHVAARALTINLDWIGASWPMAGAFAEEIRDLERTVRSIVDPIDPAERPVRIGHCPTIVDTDETPCGAVLTRRPGETSITCRWCGTTWPPARLLALGRALQDAPQLPQDAPALSTRESQQHVA